MDISERIRALACNGGGSVTDWKGSRSTSPSASERWPVRGKEVGFERGAGGWEQSRRQAGTSSHRQHGLLV